MNEYILEPESSYELIDSGDEMKLERFGDVILARPDPEALWKKKLTLSIWKKNNASYIREGKSGSWKKNQTLPKNWNMNFCDLVFEIRPTSFKHVGIFPEQKIHWQWLAEKIKRTQASGRIEPIKVLNLFAYTGGASLIAAQSGAEVTHIDASGVTITWARKNAELSGLSNAPIRWIEDDVLVFLRREIRRKNTYDIIIMDPPSFGHGPKGTLWKIEDNFLELMELTQTVLSDNPVAIIINGYTAGYSPVTLKNNLIDIKEQFGGNIEYGELLISSANSQNKLPSGIFARWSKI